MKVLLMSKYGRLGASSRIRSYQYLPYLEANGLDVTLAPLLSDQYIRTLYSDDGRNPVNVVTSYLNRVRRLLEIAEFDVVWIEKELFPWLPAISPRLLNIIDIPYLVDYDDAVFHRYDQHPNRAIRSFLGRKIDSVMKHAEVVTVGNEYLANRAKKAGAERIVQLPTVVDLDRYHVSAPENDIFTIGWIGTPNTARYLSETEPALREFCETHPAKVVLVGSGETDLAGVPTEIRPWAEETEVDNIQSFDVGIMPLPDGPVQRGKSGYKLIQYMACGRPVVASPVGVNKTIVKRNGFLADSTQEWVDSLEYLWDNPREREKMGDEGRRLVEQNFCLKITAPRLLTILQSMT